MTLVSLKEINDMMSSLDDWGIDSNALIKEFEFGSFKEAVEFVNKVAEVSERSDHHPDINVQYNSVRLTLTTHSENGITKKDFDLAKEIDKI